MATNIEKDLKDYLSFLLQTKKLAQNEILHNPKGNLHIVRDRQYIKYYYSKENDPLKKRTYIRKTEAARIHGLAQRSYARTILNKTEFQIRLVSQFLKKFDSEFILKLQNQMKPERSKLINPYIISDEDFIAQWMSLPYEGNNYKPEDKDILTNNNELVRSKGEKILADKLFALNIPYKYEYPLELSNNVHIYPDFTIMRMKDRREIYIELFGMMDNPEYCLKALKKIDLYGKAGIFPGKNLIYVFESSRKIVDTSIFELLLSDILS